MGKTLNVILWAMCLHNKWVAILPNEHPSTVKSNKKKILITMKIDVSLENVHCGLANYLHFDSTKPEPKVFEYFLL